MSEGLVICDRYLARGQRRKAALEIGDQIADVLKSDVEADRRAAGLHFVAVRMGVHVERDGKAFEAAPGRAHAVKRTAR